MASNQDDTPRPAHPLSRAAQILGSIVSVGLVIGLGIWGYKLLVRDVSGVPVIRAAEGPVRVQPEDPGGRQALNQGLSVNDVAAVGTAGAAPDQLILAPAPLDLSDEDAPAVAPAPAPAPSPDRVATEQGAPEEPPQDAPTEAETADSAPPPEEDATMLALAEALGADIPVPENLPEAPEAATGDTDAPSLRPRSRPADLRNIRTVAAVASTADPARDVDPETIAIGTRLAQLGAFSSEEIAREEWDRLEKRFREYLAGKDRVIQRATSGGRTFYRLRAMGFDDLADARRFCSALVAEKAECIPVVTR